MSTATFLPPLPCDDRLCEVCHPQGSYDDPTPPAKPPVQVVAVWSAGQWTAGRLWMSGDGDVFESDTEDDGTIVEGEYLGSIVGRRKRREEYAEEIEALAAAWEERQEELAAVRAEEEAIYRGSRL